MTIKININPVNGLHIPGIGHLRQGEHTVDMTAADLKGAEGVTIVEYANKTAEDRMPNTKPENATTLQAAIQTVIETLDADDETVWTKSGKVKTEAIEAVLGYTVSASERDQAMAEA